MLTYASETWPAEKDKLRLTAFERKILRRIYGPVKDNDIWRIRYNQELYQLYNAPNIRFLVWDGLGMLRGWMNVKCLEGLWDMKLVEEGELEDQSYVASPMSQFILQPFFRLSYVTGCFTYVTWRAAHGVLYHQVSPHTSCSPWKQSYVLRRRTTSILIQERCSRFVNMVLDRSYYSYGSQRSRPRVRKSGTLCHCSVT